MAFANNDVFEFRTVVRFAEQNFINVYHYQLKDLAGTPTLTEMGLGIQTLIVPELIDCLPEDAEYQGFGIKQIWAAETAEALSDVGAAPGGVVSDPAPSQVAAVISLRADTAPPKTRGRKFIGPLPLLLLENEDQEVDAVLFGLLTDLKNKLLMPAPFMGVGGSGNMIHVIWKRATNTPYPVTSAIVRRGFGTQRRRSSITKPDAPIFS